MIMLCWNISGCNFPDKQKVVKELCRNHKPDLFLLQETKVKLDKQEHIKKRIWKEAQFEYINAIGKARGLWILWNPTTVSVQRINFAISRRITVRVKCLQNGFSFILSNIYAPNILSNRKRFWEMMIDHRKSFPNEPWVVGGDFNSPLNMEDKLGGRVNLTRSMEDIRDFKQSNRRCGRNFIQKRLDRMLVTVEWLEEFQNADLTSLPRIALDHYPLLLNMNPWQKKRSHLKCECMWMLHPSFKENLKKWWNFKVKGIPMFRLSKIGGIKGDTQALE